MKRKWKDNVVLRIYIITLGIITQGYLCTGNSNCIDRNLYDDFSASFNKDNAMMAKYTTTTNGMAETVYYKCLSMYQEANIYNVNSSNFEECPSGLLADVIISNLASLIGEPYLGGMLKDLEQSESCIYSEFRSFWEQSRAMIKNTSNLKVQCPLGLIHDIVCVGCLNKACNLENTFNCKADTSDAVSILKPLCQNDIRNFVGSCVNDETDRDGIVTSLEDLHKGISCQHFNYIYQGLTSAKVIEGGRITAECSGNQTLVQLRCYNTESQHVPRALWQLNSTGEILSATDEDALYLSLSEITELSDTESLFCFINDLKVAEIPVHHILKICKAHREGETVDGNEGPILQTINPNNNIPTTTPLPSTTTPSNTEYGHRMKFDSFYNNNSIWTWRIGPESDSSIYNFGGINAFENRKRLQASEGKLVVPEIAIFGRRTPVCGHRWGIEEATVFCRDAGNQLQQNWEPKHFGVVKGSPGGGYYLTYIKNLNCTGQESNLIWCDHEGWFRHTCTFHAVVLCVNNEGGADPTTQVIVGCCVAVCVLVIAAGIVILYCLKRPSTVDSDSKIESIEGGRMTQDETLSLTHTFTNLTNTVSQTLSVLSMFGESIMFAISATIPEEKEDGEARVIKRLNKEAAQSPVFLVEVRGTMAVARKKEEIQTDSPENMVSQFCFLTNVEHENIIKMLDIDPISVSYTDSLSQRSELMFFMEYLELGDLDEFLRKKSDENPAHCNGHTLCAADATRLMRGVVEAVFHIQSLGYVHGDLKTDNFLVTRNSQGQLTVKLGDWESYYKSEGGLMRQMRCNARFTSPEALFDQAHRESRGLSDPDAYRNEVWALGLVLWEISSWLFCGQNVHPIQANEDGIQVEDTENGIALDVIQMDDSQYNGCSRQKHVALIETLAAHDHLSFLPRPDRITMRDFYSAHYPQVSLPALHYRIDKMLGWRVRDTIMGCLTVDPLLRWTVEQVQAEIAAAELVMGVETLPPDTRVLPNYGNREYSARSRQYTATSSKNCTIL